MTAMRLDDLPGNRQAEPGILAEALVGPIGVETLENPLEGMGGNARPIVVDADLETVARRLVRGLAGPRAAQRDPDLAARRGEGARIVDQIVDDLAKPRIMAEDQPALVRGRPRSIVSSSRTLSSRSTCR